MDDLNLLRDTSEFLHRIYEKLDKEDVLIFEQRKRLEIQAADDSKSFVLKIKYLLTEVDKLK